jgi:hypothetical protein
MTGVSQLETGRNDAYSISDFSLAVPGRQPQLLIIPLEEYMSMNVETEFDAKTLYRTQDTPGAQAPTHLLFLRVCFSPSGDSTSASIPS